MKPQPAYWKRGERAQVAKEAAVSLSYLSDVLYRRRTVSYPTAVRLELASKIPHEVWLGSLSTNHPAFCKPRMTRLPVRRKKGFCK